MKEKRWQVYNKKQKIQYNQHFNQEEDPKKQQQMQQKIDLQYRYQNLKNQKIYKFNNQCQKLSPFNKIDIKYFFSFSSSYKYILLRSQEYLTKG